RCRLEVESYDVVFVPVAEGTFFLVPSPAVEDGSGPFHMFEDSHQPVVSKPLRQVEPYLFAEDLEFWPVDMFVGYLVTVILVNVVPYLVPVQFLTISQQVWSVDLVFDRHYLVQVQQRSLSRRVALVLPIVPKHLQDLVHVLLGVRKISPHYEIVDSPRYGSVCIFV